VAISGAGPTLLAITSVGDADNVAQEMQTAWEKTGITAQVMPLEVSKTGATVKTNN
jgi:homoserine kinase